MLRIGCSKEVSAMDAANTLRAEDVSIGSNNDVKCKAPRSSVHLPANKAFENQGYLRESLTPLWDYLVLQDRPGLVT